MKAVVLIIFPFLFAVSCEEKPKEVTVVEVYGKRLTVKQLNSFIKNQSYLSDSTASADIYINSWIKQQILAHNASIAIHDDKTEIESKVESYRNQLLIHYYQNKVIDERLDTVISTSEIKEYYKKHQPDFQLKDYLVKVLYIKVAEDAPELDNLAKWYKSDKTEDETSIIQYAGLYASNFYFDKNNWIYFDEITKEIPLADINKDRFITRKSKTKFKEGNYYYFLNILDYKLKNAVSPLEFEKNNIKKRILNTRILELRDRVNQELIQKAENENAIKKY